MYYSAFLKTFQEKPLILIAVDTDIIVVDTGTKAADTDAIVVDTGTKASDTDAITVDTGKIAVDTGAKVL